MEENVALDSSKQKKFVKSLKGIKKLIKKNEEENEKAEEETKPKSSSSIKESDKKTKKPRRQRGLVYLSHIPHGFYEHQMTEYFKQFGMVTNVRVIRSKRTGNSKGYAFVEFREPAVAQIVAETMNNYLMGKRLIKAVYIPPEKQRRNAFRKNWNSQNNPGNDMRIKMKKAHNENKDEKGELSRAKQLLKNLNKTKKKLRELGINYDFFMPVDIPKGLEIVPIVKQEQTEIDETVAVKDENNVKNEDSKSTKKSKVKKEIVDTDIDKGKVKNNKKVKVKGQLKDDTDIKEKQIAEISAKVLKKSKNKSEKKDKSEQSEVILVDKDLKKKSKDKDINAIDSKGSKNKSKKEIKPLKDFIKVKDDSDESDSSYNFDSDEYENIIQNEDSSDLDNSEEDDESENTDSELKDEEMNSSDESEEGTQVVSKKSKHKATLVKKSVQPKKTKVEEKTLKRTKKEDEMSGVAAKKSKFEKQIKQKPTNKLFKRK